MCPNYNTAVWEKLLKLLYPLLISILPSSHCLFTIPKLGGCTFVRCYTKKAEDLTVVALKLVLHWKGCPGPLLVGLIFSWPYRYVCAGRGGTCGMSWHDPAAEQLRLCQQAAATGQCSWNHGLCAAGRYRSQTAS